MTQPPSLNRIERRKLRFRDNIVHTAIRLFEQNGIANTSVASIIKEADIAHKTFFNHFPSKDHLLQHIVGSFSDKGYDLFRRGLSRYSEPEKRIDFCLMTIARTLRDVKPHYKELLNFYLLSSSAAGELQSRQREGFTAIISDIIQSAAAEQRLRPGSAMETYVEMVVGICVVILLNWSLQADYPIVEKMHNATVFLNNSLFIQR